MGKQPELKDLLPKALKQRKQKEITKKLYTEAELKMAFEDSCKYQNFEDFKNHLKELKTVFTEH